MRLRGGPDLVEDVTSETFLVVWQRWSEAPTDPEGLRRWVFVIARHKLANALRARGRARDLEARSRSQAAAVVGPDHADEIVGQDRVDALLAGLTPAEKEAMQLVVAAGFTPTEAARVIGCSVTALTTRLSRARRHLERVVEQEQDRARGEAGS